MQPRQQTETDASPFHIGEQAVQSRLGVRESIEPWARQIVRPFLPDQHRQFYTQLPFVVAAARDHENRPWATLLVGPTGFVHSPDNSILHFATGLLPGDALKGSLAPDTKLGLLGIELQTRRRNRVNGTIGEIDASGFTFNVDQAFGNCPQYISERSWRKVELKPEEASVTRHQRLNNKMRNWIASADTAFLASGYRGEGDDNATYGMDASHRGGAPGFVEVLSDTRLLFPDYAGNNHFNTMGNLVLDPGIGLLFIDFETGGVLQISGKATIDWDSDAVAKHPGAQRLVTVDIEQIVLLEGVLPLRWSAAEESIGTLRVAKKTRESVDVTSFELVACDDRELPEFEAGQHLPVELQIDGSDLPIKRTYSLSNGPGEGRYRISVKREPMGVASRHLHEKLQVGNLVRAAKPGGDFVLEQSDRPVALISAGIGVTPMVSMLRAITGGGSNRRVHFIHGARDGTQHPLAAEIRGIAQRHENVNLEVVYSQPRSEDTPGEDYSRLGRINGDLIEELIPGLDADFFLCGPTGFLADVASALTGLGVSTERIRTETF